MKPTYKPQTEGETALLHESVPKRVAGPVSVNELTFYTIERYFEAREHDGLKWFEISKDRYFKRRHRDEE